MPASSSPVRIYVDDDLSQDGRVELGPDQTHYLTRVMRLTPGAHAHLFNGRHGEWVSRIDAVGKRSATLRPIGQHRTQCPEPDIWLAFAPVKKSRTDFAVEKATELGVSRLVPVVTQFTSTRRVNTERLQATAREAAEQCGRLTVPSVAALHALPDLLRDWPRERRLYALDETGAGAPSSEAFQAPPPTVGFVTGPEGGFSESELDLLRGLDFVTPVSLGPHTLRAETAIAAALAAYQAIAGDWR